jgi:hypothetical protein
VATDLDSNARFVDDAHMADTGSGTPPIVDMGPHEFPPDCRGNLHGDRNVDELDSIIRLAAWRSSGEGDSGILPTNCGSDCP